MKKQTYYKIDRYGNITTDKFSTYINNNNWLLPVVVILIMLAAGWVEGNL